MYTHKVYSIVMVLSKKVILQEGKSPKLQKQRAFKKRLRNYKFLKVEPAGVEPASKQVTKVLSTCLSHY